MPVHESTHSAPAHRLSGADGRTAPAAGPRRRHLYRLKFAEEEGRPAKDLEFEAVDSYQALIIAHKEARTCSAELWRDGRKLCSIRRMAHEVWEISPPDNAPARPAA